MSDSPEVLKDESGTWVRRDVFVAETADEMDESAERVDGVLGEMIENDDEPMQSQMVGDDEYVQLSGVYQGMKAMARYRTRQAKDKATRFLRSDDDE